MSGADSFQKLCGAYPVLKPMMPQICAAFSLLRDCVGCGGTIYTCGNGGSAADAEHIVGELMKSFLLPRPLLAEDRAALVGADADFGSALAKGLQKGIRAISLVSGISLSTAIANDVLSELVYAQQIYALGRPGDVLWGISTSGNSRNVNCALVAAHACGVKTLGLTAGNGGRMAGLCDVELRVPTDSTPEAQEMHLPIYHALCAALEAEFFGVAE